MTLFTVAFVELCVLSVLEELCEPCGRIRGKTFGRVKVMPVYLIKSNTSN